jgi:hypothetical protein
VTTLALDWLHRHRDIGKSHYRWSTTTVLGLRCSAAPSTDGTTFHWSVVQDTEDVEPTNGDVSGDGCSSLEAAQAAAELAAASRFYLEGERIFDKHRAPYVGPACVRSIGGANVCATHDADCIEGAQGQFRCPVSNGPLVPFAEPADE